MANKSQSIAPAYSILNTSKYYCTLTLMDYDRPKPFDPGKYNLRKVIRLPLPLELRDDTAVAYNNVDLKVVGDVANKDIAGIGAEGLRQVGSLFAAGGGAITAGLSNIQGKTGSAGGGIAAGVTGAALDNAIDAEAITSAFQQAFGVAPNPNPSVAFQGPSLREMSFTWTFMPTNEKDSRNIRNICNYLKSAALPRANVSGESAAILEYPSLCQMNWFPWDNGGKGAYGWNEDTSIIKMKRCFMSSVNVNYTSGAAPSFFAGTNLPTIIQLSINMKEIEYFMAHDYGDKADSKGFFGGLNDLLKGVFNADFDNPPPPEGTPSDMTDQTAGSVT